MAWQQNEIDDTARTAAFGATFVTDKIEPQGYFQTYLKIAADLGPRASVCEIGVWQGESLRMWQALFPLGKVTGVDYTTEDRVWPEGTTQVVSPQDDEDLPRTLEKMRATPLDLIVDDASHEGYLTRTTFLLLWPLVAPGGYYVIEDAHFGLSAPAMFSTITDLIRLLASRDAECDWVHYRYGLAIAHKRA